MFGAEGIVGAVPDEGEVADAGVGGSGGLSDDSVMVGGAVAGRRGGEVEGASGAAGAFTLSTWGDDRGAAVSCSGESVFLIARV